MSASNPTRRLRRLLEQAHDYALDYIDGVASMRVVPDDEARRRLIAFDEPLPEKGAPPEEMLETLHRVGSPATSAQTGGRYYGFVNGGLHPPALAARWLADAWDQNAALAVMSPVAAKLEEVCERWLVELFGLPPTSAAGLVTGTSMSLVTGLAAARDELCRRQGWDVAAAGLSGSPRLRVVLGEDAHASALRALAILGLGRDRVERVPCDRQGRMRADALPSLDERCLLLLQAGNVNSGAFDPFGELCGAAREAGAWTHVDGAFGLWAAASPATAPLYRGAELADSWSVDAHKTLNAPYDCGIILCRDRQALKAAMQSGGAYLEWSEERDGMAYTPDMSRRARAVELWATLKTLGRAGVAALVEQLAERARQFAAELESAGFRVLNDVVFNQVLVAAADGDETRRLLAGIQASGECWCGGTTWHGEPAIRVSVCSWATTAEDVRRSVAVFARVRDTLSG